MANEEASSIFRRWVNGLRSKRGPEISTLNIGGDMPAIGTRVAPNNVNSGKTAAPKDGTDETHLHKIIRFTDPRTNVVFVGHPVMFLAGVRHASIEAGSRNSQGTAGIWANDLQMLGQTDWSDDAQFGLFQKKIVQPKHALGCMGMIEATPYQFSDILQIGENVLIYQLTNLLTGAFFPLGMGRGEVDPVYGLSHYLHQTGQGKRKYLPPEVIRLCDRVLDAFADDETALFNKGVALLAENDAQQAHTCFEMLVQLKPEDLLALLHNAATLAKLGEDNRAIEMLKDADSLSAEGCKTMLDSVASVRDPLNELIVKTSQENPERRDAWELWQKYFLPRLETKAEPRENRPDA